MSKSESPTEKQKSMNLEFGCEILVEEKGKQWFRGAGTDWCYFPVEWFSDEELRHAKRRSSSGSS